LCARRPGRGAAARAPRNELVQRLDPPYDKSNLAAGCIGGGVPGARANGGQSTRAGMRRVAPRAVVDGVERNDGTIAPADDQRGRAVFARTKTTRVSP